MRQIEAAELMNTAGNYATSYAKALLAATRQSDLVKSDQPKRIGGLTSEQMTRMEREMEAVQQDLKAVEARYGDDVLHLVIACGYVSKLITCSDQLKMFERPTGQAGFICMHAALPRSSVQKSLRLENAHNPCECIG